MRASPPLPAAAIAACCLLAAPAAAWAAQGTHVDSVRFVQYLDENTALEEVRAGNLDVYYHAVPPDRVEDPRDREGLRVYDSTGGSYSILANPAEPASGALNPFSLREVRFALNYMVDRGLVVNELMGGYGVPMVSNYGPFDPDYMDILEAVRQFNFEYSPALARSMAGGAMEAAGASRGPGGAWEHGGEPVVVRLFIRSDDPVRKSVGEVLAAELEDAGFSVERDYGDLNKAFAVVYGSDPADMEWSLYTEGWGGRSAFVRYDSVGLSQMYAPWFSSMPGFNDPSYWNYENEGLDDVTRAIYSGGFGSAGERAALVREATEAGIRESVRVFLAAKVDRYVASDGVEGVVNDLAAGVPSRFTPINARTASGSLDVGVKQIYQGAWNPVAGLGDSYSRHVWNALYDPAIFSHPHSGESMPVRAEWGVDAPGRGLEVAVPQGAIRWSPELRDWEEVPPGTGAGARVTFDFALSDWHHGEPMDMNDVLYSVYFASEWGTGGGEGDDTFDSEYTPRAAPSAGTLVGVRPLDGDTMEVYVDYWHFDESEIASWASPWAVMPWEIYAAMEEVVLDGRASFSKSGAASRGAGWLSLVVPNDAALVAGALRSMAGSGEPPPPLARFGDAEYFAGRYSASLGWIADRGHAVISNGPFYLEGYAPESRTMLARAFADDSYPFPAGTWQRLEDVRFPRISAVYAPDTALRGEPLSVEVEAADSTALRYFVSDPAGREIASGAADVSSGSAAIRLGGGETARLGLGANDLELFAVSDGVLRPDRHAVSFLAVDPAGGGPPGPPPLPGAGPEAPDAGGRQGGAGGEAAAAAAVAAAAAAAVAAAVAARRRRGRRPTASSP